MSVTGCEKALKSQNLGDQANNGRRKKIFSAHDDDDDGEEEEGVVVEIMKNRVTKSTFFIEIYRP